MPTVAASSLRPVRLDLTPVEVAARLRQRAGLVFFDSALDGARGSQLSVIAAEPTRIFRGSLENDAPLLREALATHRTEPADLGVPAGFLAGSVDYDSTFCFGEYEHALIYRHADASWMEVGDGAALLRGLATLLEHERLSASAAVPPAV